MGGHTFFIFKIGHTGAFRPKSAEIGQNHDFRVLGARKTDFLAAVETPYIIAGSIADAFGSNITFFKNRLFLGVLGAFLGQSKSWYFTDFIARSVFRLSL